MLRDARIGTSHNVAFSISGNVKGAFSRTHWRSASVKPARSARSSATASIAYSSTIRGNSPVRTLSDGTWIFSGALGRIHPAAGSWSTRRLAIFAVVRRDRDPPGRCRQLSPRWLRSEEQLVSLSPEPPMGGRIEKHAGCHVATSVLAAGRRARVRWAARAPRRRRDAGASPGEPSFALSVKASLAARGASRP
jgi:hypothetical protein